MGAYVKRGSICLVKSFDKDGFIVGAVPGVAGGGENKTEYTALSPDVR